MTAMPYMTIDVDLLKKAQDFYLEQGYQVTPTPWLVGPAAYLATAPKKSEGISYYRSPNGLYMVASAEQGFMQLIDDGVYIPKKAQSITPCYRDEKIYDKRRLPYFYKLELFYRASSHSALMQVINDAKKLFAQCGIKTKIVQTADMAYDLETDDDRSIEVGSYGIRTFKGVTWIYGTGVALPRLMI